MLEGFHICIYYTIKYTANSLRNSMFWVKGNLRLRLEHKYVLNMVLYRNNYKLTS